MNKQTHLKLTFWYKCYSDLDSTSIHVNISQSVCLTWTRSQRAHWWVMVVRCVFCSRAVGPERPCWWSGLTEKWSQNGHLWQVADALRAWWRIWGWRSSAGVELGVTSWEWKWGIANNMWLKVDKGSGSKRKITTKHHYLKRPGAEQNTNLKQWECSKDSGAGRRGRAGLRDKQEVETGIAWHARSAAKQGTVSVVPEPWQWAGRERAPCLFRGVTTANFS